ncbi:hypothetical protein ACRS8P_15005 [Burkholderia cenocepacia]
MPEKGSGVTQQRRLRPTDRADQGCTSNRSPIDGRWIQLTGKGAADLLQFISIELAHSFGLHKKRTVVGALYPHIQRRRFTLSAEALTKNMDFLMVAGKFSRHHWPYGDDARPQCGEM